MRLNEIRTMYPWLTGVVVVAVVVTGLVVAVVVMANHQSSDDRAVAAACAVDWNYGASNADNFAFLERKVREARPDSPVAEIIDRASNSSHCEGSGVEEYEFQNYLSSFADSASAQPSAAPSAGPAPSTPTQDNSVPTELAARGITATDVSALAAVAAETGYGNGPGIPLSQDDAEGLAVAMLEVCDHVAAGDLTWEDQVNQDIADGADPADAQQMNAFVRSSFCP